MNNLILGEAINEKLKHRFEIAVNDMIIDLVINGKNKNVKIDTEYLKRRLYYLYKNQ